MYYSFYPRFGRIGGFGGLGRGLDGGVLFILLGGGGDGGAGFCGMVFILSIPLFQGLLIKLNL